MNRFGRKDLNSRRLRVESLESRTLLAGHSAGASITLAAAAMNHDLPATVTAHVASPIAGASTTASQVTVLTAHLTDSNSSSLAMGNAVFHSHTANTQTKSQLEVQIHHGLANTTYDVSDGTTMLGKITTNAKGAGHLVLVSNPKGSHQGLPTGFTVAAGDTLTVTAEGTTSDTLSGTFAVPVPPVITNLKATLTAPTGSTGKAVASYHTVTKNGTTDAELDILVTGAAPNSSLSVSLNGGTPIGTVKTDAHGRGFLEFSDPSLTITSGETITVGTLTGTFATASKM